MPDDAQLFDPDPYSDLTRLHRRQRRRSPKVETEAQTVREAGWTVLARLKHRPTVAAHLVTATNRHGSVTTWCGIAGRALVEIEVGTDAVLCQCCADKSRGERSASA